MNERSYLVHARLNIREEELGVPDVDKSFLLGFWRHGDDRVRECGLSTVGSKAEHEDVAFIKKLELRRLSDVKG